MKQRPARPLQYPVCYTSGSGQEPSGHVDWDLKSLLLIFSFSTLLLALEIILIEIQKLKQVMGVLSFVSK